MIGSGMRLTHALSRLALAGALSVTVTIADGGAGAAETARQSASAPDQTAAAPAYDLRTATILIAPTAGEDERLAANVLREEIAARTGLSWPIATAWPAAGPVVALGIVNGPYSTPAPSPGTGAIPLEGYSLTARRQYGRPMVSIVAAGRRGLLYAVGGLLRALDWGRQTASLPHDLAIETAPRYPLRGHQLGYRHHSNTYDAWTPEQFDRYIRELALFGANAIENIPFQDARPAPLMPVSRATMARRISEICAKYDLQYWLWTPADFRLDEATKRRDALDALDALFADLPRLDAIFLPGGDPGDNDATLVVPWLGDVARRLRARHPRAKMWLSLQHFDAREVDFLFAWIDREHPDWLGGLIGGPGSAPLATMRARLDRRYQIRDYPDIGHTVRCQFPVPAWDPAFNFTLGREPINPRPAFYARVHDETAADTDGFITYSDGVNDDVNKIVWTRKAWDPTLDVRTILVEYARVFFGPVVAERAADGLLALERNWEGPLAENGGVAATLALWREIEREAPEIGASWRGQMALLRASYDAYTRDRLRLETSLEAAANGVLATAPRVGAAAAMDRAAAVLAGPPGGCCPVLRRRIDDLAAALFTSIRLQTSVPKHGASGYERGAILDFVDHPLNNRWWLEDQFAAVRALGDEASRLARLETIRTWSHPGPGSFYDDIGNVGQSPHVTSGETDGERQPGEPIPHFTWEGGPTRKRLSWLTSLRWPAALAYDHLDPSVRYRVWLHVITNTAAGQVRLRIDGAPAPASNRAVAIGDRQTFDVPVEASRDGRVVLTFDPVDERQLNWRQYSRLVEAWLVAESDAASPAEPGANR
jgi:hypothetical protein